MLIEMRAPADLRPCPNNPRSNDGAVDAVASSIQQFGFQSPIVVDANYEIICGHTRWKAATKLGLAEVPVHVAKDLTPDQIRAFRIADNKTGEIAEWNFELLKIEIAGLQDAGFDIAPLAFDADELAKIMGTEVVAGNCDPNDVPLPPDDPITKPGDLWILGDHRLLCADCRDGASFARLVDGRSVNVAFTSPPYSSRRKYDESSGFRPIPPAEYCAWFADVAKNVKLALSPDGSWFVNIKAHCEDGQRSLYVNDLVIAHVREWGWMLVDELCWKRKGVPGGWCNRFKNEWEPVFHFARQGKIKFRKTAVAEQSAHAFTVSNRSKRGRESVFDCNSDNGKTFHDGMALPGNVVEVNGRTPREHNAAFPVGLPAFFLKAYSDPGDVICDPFLGSGTTLIAAEQLGRRCFGLEISPQYCDVIVRRWEKFTGRKAERIPATGNENTPVEPEVVA